MGVERYEIPGLPWPVIRYEPAVVDGRQVVEWSTLGHGWGFDRERLAATNAEKARRRARSGRRQRRR